MKISRIYLPAIALLCFVSCSETPVHNAGPEDNIDSLLLSGITYTNQLEFDKAHSNLTQVTRLASIKKDHRLEILGNVNLGALYFKFSAEEEALKYFLEALELAKQNNQSQLLNTIYNNIGIVYSENNSSKEALEYLEMALEISRKQKTPFREAVNLINLGNEYHRVGQNEKALEYFEESYKIFEASGDTVNASVAIQSIGEIFYDRKEYTAALFKFKEAFKKIEPVKELFYTSQLSLKLGRTYYQFQQYDSAVHFLQQGLGGFEKTHNTEYIIDSYNSLSAIEEKKGNFQDALSYSNLSQAWKDSLLEEKTGKWISEIQMNYEFGKKEKEIELLQKEAENQRNFWIAVILCVIISTALLLYLFRSKNINLRQKNKLLEKEQEVNRLTLAKNRAERSQLEKDIQLNRKLNELEKAQLEQELKFKERALASNTLHLVNKNEVFGELLNILNAIDANGDKEVQQLISRARRRIKANDNSDEEWKSFQRHFEEVHPEFFTSLKEINPELSANDLRLCAYLMLDLNAKEIAQIFNITPESVRKRKQRLRMKLNIGKDHDITAFLKKHRENMYPVIQ